MTAGLIIITAFGAVLLSFYEEDMNYLSLGVYYGA